jgi:hypothetical protein
MTLPPAAGANPSVDQYVESVPTGEGDTNEDDHGDGKAHPLPSHLRDRLRDEGGSDAPQLEKLATEPALGAPAVPRAEDDREAGGGRGDDAGRAEPARPSALDATTAAAVDGAGNTMEILLAGVVLLTAAAAGLAFARRRSEAA